MNGWQTSKSSMNFLNKFTINGIIKAECQTYFVKFLNKAARLISHNIYI